ncbi:MAG: hypothetical protein KDJ37_09380 [Hyphomicrobiaceae bacterium]|nr:hypothetical protein [Hyphomicrobiaceae bacterium]
MPQAFLLALAGAGLYYGARFAARQLDRIAKEAERAAAEMKRRAEAQASEAARDLGTLEFDATTGQYRPR